MNSFILPLFVAALKKVTNHILKDFKEISYLQLSSPNSHFGFANQNYLFVENKLLEDLLKFKPDYCYTLGSGKTIANKDVSNNIVINSICGFNNFKRGIPHFAVSLTLLRDGKPFSCAIYLPTNGDLYTAEQGKGALLNQQKLLLRNYNNPQKDFLVATDTTTNLNLGNANFAISNCKILDLCYLASNKLDLCYFKKTTNFNNIAAGILLANEVGLELDLKQEDPSLINNLIVGHLSVKKYFKL